MPQAIDPEWLGQRVRAVRRKRKLTLREVSEQTGISVATLSRIERGAAQGLSSDTLIILSDWAGVELNTLKRVAPPVAHRGKAVTETPDIVALHLRADVRGLFWNLKYPESYRREPIEEPGTPEEPNAVKPQGNLSEWSLTPMLQVGIGYIITW